MEKENFKIDEPEITFPEESGLIVEKILEKYGFKDAQEEKIKELVKSKNPRKRNEIFENLPGYKISKLVKKYAEGRVSLKNISLLLEKGLDIPKEEATKIARELEKKLLISIQPAKKEKLVPSKVPPTETKPLDTLSPKKQKPLQKPDVYRESVE